MILSYAQEQYPTGARRHSGVVHGRVHRGGLFSRNKDMLLLVGGALNTDTALFILSLVPACAFVSACVAVSRLPANQARALALPVGAVVAVQLARPNIIPTGQRRLSIG
jgi:hypothetical protein